MLVTLYPGANRADVLKTLREIATALYDPTNASGPAQARFTKYLEWVSNAIRMLENRVSQADINRLVLTAGYGRLLSAAAALTGADIGTQRALNGMLDLELRQRCVALEDAAKDLDSQIRRWNAATVFTVADTGVYINHEQKLRELDFAVALAIPAGTPVRVLVPIIVIDELDGLKRMKDEHVRWRAGHTLGVLDEIIRDPRQPGQLRPGITMEILFDPPGHIRLPIDDDEIVDRARAAQAVAGADVTLLTFDTGQSSRARYAGIRAVKLPMPLGDEPTGLRVKKKASGGSLYRPADVPSSAEEVMGWKTRR